MSFMGRRPTRCLDLFPSDSRRPAQQKRITTGRISDQVGCHEDGFFQNGFADSELQSFRNFLTRVEASSLPASRLNRASKRTVPAHPALGEQKTNMLEWPRYGGAARVSGI